MLPLAPYRRQTSVLEGGEFYEVSSRSQSDFCGRKITHAVYYYFKYSAVVCLCKELLALLKLDYLIKPDVSVRSVNSPHRRIILPVHFSSVVYEHCVIKLEIIGIPHPFCHINLPPHRFFFGTIIPQDGLFVNTKVSFPC